MTEDQVRAERMTFTLMRCALACVMITIIGGASSILFYIEQIAKFLNGYGIQFQNLRPLHTTFASAWIFLGGVACVHRYLFSAIASPTPGDRKRFRFQMVCWGLAGAGICLTLPFGLSSGREYLGFHPIFSLLILAGWLAFAVTFFKKVSKGFFERPVYVYMWGTGVLFFVFTFIEGHAYLIPQVRNYPIADLQIQWKHCGTLVASFNMLVYGALLYLGELVTGDKSYARSTKAFVFLGIGMLNSFTNYAHHTYHIPQDHLIKWVAFVVSMIEIIILVSIFNDLRRAIAKTTPTDRFTQTTRYLAIGRAWSFGLLALALLISVPPLNAVIHGTRVVMAHAMGSEIGIDTLVLFAFFSFVIEDAFSRCWRTQAWLRHIDARRLINRLNGSLIALFLWLMLDGLVTGITRAQSMPLPEWLAKISPMATVVLGTIHAYYLLRVVHDLGMMLKRPVDRRRLECDVFPDYPVPPRSLLPPPSTKNISSGIGDDVGADHV
ncbi:MAG: cbb3-type cytochrome c oxidase subunit I [Planctomycetota bacterium]